MTMMKPLAALTVAAGIFLPFAASAQTNSAPAATVDQDVMCFMTVSTFLAVLSKNPDANTPAIRETVDSLHRALGFYTARVTMRIPAAQLAPQLTAASKAVDTYSAEKKAEIAGNCLDGLAPDLRKLADAMGA